MEVHVTPRGQKYSLTRHASIRMSQRNVNHEHIEYVLDNHETPYRDHRGNSCCECNLVDGRRIRAIVADSETIYKIITVIVL